MKKGQEIATIDVALITVEVPKGDGTTFEVYGLNTASKIVVEIQEETEEAKKLIVKGQLIAQKPETTTITGNKITLTDNVFNPQLVQVFQGGTLTMGTGADADKVIKYTPPVAGSLEKGKVFKLTAYSAIYDAAALITGYEKITYPNCQGKPLSMGSEDNVFRVPEYTIVSAPKIGEPPYELEYIKTLPVFTV